jgi:hypothetical protein
MQKLELMVRVAGWEGGSVLVGCERMMALAMV